MVHSKYSHRHQPTPPYCSAKHHRHRKPTHSSQLLHLMKSPNTSLSWEYSSTKKSKKCSKMKRKINLKGSNKCNFIRRHEQMKTKSWTLSLLDRGVKSLLTGRGEQFVRIRSTRQSLLPKPLCGVRLTNISCRKVMQLKAKNKSNLCI